MAGKEKTALFLTLAVTKLTKKRVRVRIILSTENQKRSALIYVVSSPKYAAICAAAMLAS